MTTVLVETTGVRCMDAATSPAKSDDGIECRRCHAVGRWKVTHKRDIPGAIRRRRVCLECGRPQSTIEVAAAEFYAEHATNSIGSENSKE